MEQISVITKIKKDNKFKDKLLILMQIANIKKPSIISIKPDGEIFFKDIQNWVSIGFNRTKSRVPSLTYLTISAKFGLNQVFVTPFKMV